MNRRMLAALVLPGLALAAPQGWLSDSREEPPLAATSTAAPAPLPVTVPGAPKAIDRDLRLHARDQDLGDVMPILLKLAFPEGKVRSAVPPREDRRKVSVKANGRFEHVLEAVGAAANLKLVQVGDEIRAQGRYQAPPPHPPTPGDIEDLAKSIRLRANDQNFGKVVQTLATFAGKTAVIPGTEYKLKVSLNLSGNLAQGLEALGAMTRLRLWVDGPLLRVSQSCIRRERPYARPPTTASRLVSLTANDQELAKVTNVLSTFWGDTIPAVSTFLSRQKVSLDVSNATPLQVMAAIEDQLTGVEAFLDGPFLRIQPRAQPCQPPPQGPAWQALEDLLYRSPSR